MKPNDTPPSQNPAVTDAASREIYNMAMNREDILSADHTHSIAHELRFMEDRYGPGQLVAQGGMKKIFRMEDRLTGRHVAMAVLSKDSDSVEHDRFIREARLTASLEHPNIMPVYDLGFNSEGSPFFTMKYTGDKNLNQLLKEFYFGTSSGNGSPGKSAWPLFERLNLFIGICEGIAYAHSRNILHLDLKPHNILVGSFGEVLICDWGLGKVLFEPEPEEDSHTETSQIDSVFLDEITRRDTLKGSPGYMAPEQIDLKLASRTQRTDVYCLGGILFALLTGSPPVTGKSIEEICKNTRAGKIGWENLARHQVPHALDAVLKKALATDPDRRYPSIVAFKQDVSAFMGGYATEAENAGFMRNFYLLAKRYKFASVFALVLLASSVLFTIYLIHSESRARHLLGLYTQAKDTYNEYREENRGELFQQARQTLENHAFVKAILIGYQLVSDNPEDPEGWNLLGEAHFWHQEFNLAAKALANGSGYNKRSLLPLAQKYARIKQNDDARLAAEDVFKLIRELDTPEQKIHMFARERTEFSNLEQHMRLVRYMIRFTNPQAKNLHCEYRIENGLVHMDISNNPELNSLYALKGLPLASLNIENTGITPGQMRFLEGMPIRTLNFAGTPIRNFPFLENLPYLNTITISRNHYSVKKLTPLYRKYTVIQK